MLQVKEIKTSRAILYALIILFVATSFYWIQRDKVPPMWDQAEYLDRSEILYSTLTKEGLAPFLASLPDIHKTKAPLIAVLPIPLYIILGDKYETALLINLIFIVLGSLYLFRIGTLLSNERAGLISVFVLNTFPLVFGLSREYLVEFGLMVFVIMWMYYCMKPGSFEHRKDAYRTGLLLGLGLLMKTTFLLYVLPSTLYLCFRKSRDRGGLPAPVLRNALISALVGFGICSFWYIENLSSVVQYIFSAGYGKIAQNYSAGDIFSWKTVLNYWLYLINYGISSYYFALAVLSVLAGAILYFRNRETPVANRDHLYSLLIWFFIPLAVFTFGASKDYRFVLPIFPAAALLLGALLETVSRRYGKSVVLALLFFPLVNYFYVSFSSGPVSLNVKQFIILESYLGYAHRPIRERWPLRKVIEFISKDASAMGNCAPVATLLFNHQYFNTINLSYYSKRSGSKTTFDDLPEGNPVDDIASRTEQKTDYLLTKSANLGPEFTIAKNLKMIEMLNRGELKFKQIALIRFPDKTNLAIYRRTGVDLVYPNREVFKKQNRIDTTHSVNFSDKIGLLASEIRRSKDGCRLILFWECLSEVDLNYKIFVHVRDEHDNVIMNLDHYPANNKYAVPRWRRGEIIKDEVEIGRVPEVFHINIGIYEETLGERLPVKEKQRDDAVNVNGVRII